MYITVSYQGKDTMIVADYGGNMIDSDGKTYFIDNSAISSNGRTWEENFARAVYDATMYKETGQTTATNDRFEKLRQMVSLFPNPAKDIVHIQLNNSGNVQLAEKNALTVWTVDGRQVNVYPKVNKMDAQINTVALADGTYLLRLLTTE